MIKKSIKEATLIELKAIAFDIQTEIKEKNNFLKIIFSEMDKREAEIEKAVKEAEKKAAEEPKVEAPVEEVKTPENEQG